MRDFPMAGGMRLADIGGMSQPHSSPGHHALRKGRSSEPGRVYLLTTTTAGRVPVFADALAAHAACRRFEDTRLLGDARMLAWVLMPDHVHWLLALGDAKPLHKVVESLKCGSARDVNAALGRRGTLWAKAYHDRALRHEEDVRAAARYVVANPLRARLVDCIGQYPYWNAIWL